MEQDAATTLALLRRRINAYESSIYCVHPEVLSLVASYLPSEDLVKATHVSHRWRAILLDFPSLWADLDFGREEEALTFFKRSGSAPISVSMDVGYPNDFFVRGTFLMEHATRVKSLVISGLEYIAQYERTLLPPMASLRRLDISLGMTGRLYKTDDRTNVKLSLPSLTTLTLRGGDSFPFSFPQLTRFQVHSNILAEDKLLHFLKRCPLLEELEVDHAHGVITWEDDDIVALPHLRLYGHRTNRNVHPILLDKLRLPPSCSVVFNYWNGSTDERKPYIDTPFYNPSPLTNIKRIHLKTIQREEGFVDATVELIDALGNRVHLMKSVGGDRLKTGYGAMNGLYTAYLKGLDTRTVEVLCVGGPDPGPLDSAKEVLSCLREVKTLVLSGDVVPPYIDALSPKGPERCYSYEEADLNTNEWQCMKLDTLVIHARNFYCGPRNDEILYDLDDIAERRKKAGVPLKFVSVFIPRPWEEYDWETMDSAPVLSRLKLETQKFEIVLEDDAMDWDIDDYFF